MTGEETTSDRMTLEEMHITLDFDRRRLFATIMSLGRSGRLSFYTPWGSARLPAKAAYALAHSNRLGLPSRHHYQPDIHSSAQWLFEWRMTVDDRPRLRRFVIEKGVGDQAAVQTIQKAMESISGMETMFVERKKE
jgi:hypothetical protein